MLTLPVQHALARSELFAACDPQRVVCRVQFFAKNSRIAAGLEKEPAVGLIVRGKVLVYSWGLDGKAVGLSTLKLGESFGISNILTGEELTTMLISGGQTAIAYIPKRCFLELLEHTPGMMLRYATLCNQKLRYLTEKIAFLAIPSCRARLATPSKAPTSTRRWAPPRAWARPASCPGVGRCWCWRDGPLSSPGSGTSPPGGATSRDSGNTPTRWLSLGRKSSFARDLPEQSRVRPNLANDMPGLTTSLRGLDTL
jgi:hypothetical protein